MGKKDDTTDTLLVLLTLALIPAMLCLRGVVVSFAWGWFITPTLGLRALSIGGGLGLSIMATLLTTPNFTPKNDEKSKPVLESIIHGIVLNAVLLAFAYVVHLVLGPTP